MAGGGGPGRGVGGVHAGGGQSETPPGSDVGDGAAESDGGASAGGGAGCSGALDRLSEISRGPSDPGARGDQESAAVVGVHAAREDRSRRGMTTEALIGAVGGVIGILGGFGHLIYLVGRLSLKVDTLWDMVVTGAKVDMVRAGWGKPGSAIEVTPVAYQRLLPYLPEMISVYRALRSKKLGISEW